MDQGDCSLDVRKQILHILNSPSIYSKRVFQTSLILSTSLEILRVACFKIDTLFMNGNMISLPLLYLIQISPDHIENFLIFILNSYKCIHRMCIIKRHLFEYKQFMLRFCWKKFVTMDTHNFFVKHEQIFIWYNILLIT